MEALYQNAKTIKSLKSYFQPYLNLLSKPSGHKLFLIFLAIISMQFVTSISCLYKWFLSNISSLSLNSYYHLFSYAQIPLDAFFKITVRTAAGLIPEELRGLPVFLIIDDTLQLKFGTHFECYQTMYDHAKHNGSLYMKGHCFVALMISVPVIVCKQIRYLSIPVGFHLRAKDENKLEIVAKMLDIAMEPLSEYPCVILLCDSWYPKGAVRKTVTRYRNLDLVANVRIDTSMYELPPPRTGKRGRPAEKGAAIDIYKDFHFIRVEDYFIGVKHVLTNLFKEPVYAMLTTPDPDNRKTYRLFISTMMPENIHRNFKGYEKKLSDRLTAQCLWLLPLHIYAYRWSIEVCFYEMKTFWSFGRYMVRSKKGIECFVNLLAMSYASMKVMPLTDQKYSSHEQESVQSTKYALGEAIRREIFLWEFVTKSQNDINSLSLFDSLSVSDVSSSKLTAS